jgi:methylthioribose-1-phosphate isomerase
MSPQQVDAEARTPSVEEINDLLPYLLKRENVARYEDGRVLITDRRKFPFEKTLVVCASVEEVARAIEEMVTQGGGPSIAAAYALAMAARQNKNLSEQPFREAIQRSRDRLTATRPTNTALRIFLDKLCRTAAAAHQRGDQAEAVMLEEIRTARDQALKDYWLRGRYGADLIKNGAGVLTMCFAESSLMMTLALARQDGKEVQVFVPETRPYLQGARLTAPSVQELGMPVTLITDGMPAHLMSQGKVDSFFTAADLITLDGHVVNKIGTFQIALAASYHRIPYFAFLWGADQQSPDRNSVTIEERAPADLRTCRGKPTTLDSISAYYPAFDITPPHLIAGIITSRGVFSPYDLINQFAESES